MSEVPYLLVFLSAPGDVQGARVAVRGVVNHLAAEPAFHGKHVEIVAWDDPSQPMALDASLTPGEAMAQGLPLPSECDAVVAIVWSRMGTPIEHDGQRYLSATHYELEEAIGARRRPPILVYRWIAPAEQAWADFPAGETPDQQHKQLAATHEFLGRVEELARAGQLTLTPFVSIAEFDDLLRRQLQDALTSPAEQHAPAPAAAPESTRPPTKPASGQLIIFLSAVSDEFRGYRAQLRDDLMRAAEVGSVIQEDFEAVGEGTLEGLDVRIRGSAAVVHLIGDMAGFVPPPSAVRRLIDRYPVLPQRLGLDSDALLAPDSAISYTHWEAYLAIHHDRKLFIAEAARDATREPATYRRDAGQLAAQQAHRERLRRMMDRWHELQFDGPDDIARKLLPALAGQHADRFMGASVWSLGARQFDEYYLKGRTLDGREVPAPFGGRQRELAHLDSWLDDPGRDPRLLVSAPAGRGKSALLARWMEALKQAKRVGPEGWRLVFVPISNRFQTNRATVYLELLARQLSQVAREHIIPPSVDPEPFWRNAASRLIAGLAEAGTPTLIVLDGLDEALGEERLANLLPAVLPPTLKVLVSARWIAGDGDGNGWLERLGWIGTGRPADHDLVVDPLDIPAIADVLIEMGAPLADAGRDSALVCRLAELTEGDPLMLRFYAEDLWLKSGPRSPITLATLDRMEPGFGPFFKVWLQDQGGIAAEPGGQIDPRTTDATLAILGFAKGPLTGSDLLGVGAAGFPTLPWRLLAAPHVAPFRRFVIGDGTDELPYVFSHPKVAQYMRTSECESLADPVVAAYFVWGRDHVARLNTKEGPGKLRPEQASRYALDHYADHLGDVADTATAEDYMAMVEDGWRRAREHYDGGPAGFARDVRAAWTACRRDGPVAHLGAQWRCALALSSIKSLGTNIPGPLIVQLVKHDQLSPTEARYYLDLKGPVEEAVEGLARLAVHAAERGDARQAQELYVATLEMAAQSLDAYTHLKLLLINGLDILGQRPLWATMLARRDRALAVARSVARTIADNEARAYSLAAVAARLTESELRNAVLADALAAAREIDRERRAKPLAVVAARLTDFGQLADALAAAHEVDLDGRAEALAAVAARLTDPGQLADALAAARKLLYEQDRAAVLAAVAARLTDPSQLAAVLADARALRTGGHRADVLVAVAARLTDLDQRDAVLTEALAAARSIDLAGSRAHALVAVAAHVTDLDQRHAVLADALVAAREMDSAEDRADAFAAVADQLTDPGLRDAVLTEALAAARSIDWAGDRAQALVAVAARLNDPSLRDAVLADALAGTFAAAREIGCDYYWAEALAAVAAHLTDVGQLADALAAARAIKDEEHRGQAVAAVAARLTDHRHLADALAAALAIRDERYRAQAVAAVAARLTDPGHLAAALKAARVIAGQWHCALALAAIAAHLADPGLRDAVLAAALDAARATTHDDKDRAQALAAVSAHLIDLGQLADSLAAAVAIRDEFHRAKALAAVTARLTDHGQLADALTAAVAIRDESFRAKPLAAVAARLTDPGQLAAVLAAARALSIGWRRANVLVAVAARLTDLDQRDAVLAEALVAARSIEWAGDRAHALVAVAAHLTDLDQRHAVLVDALVTASSINSAGDRANTVATVAARLTGPGLRDAALAHALGAARATGRKRAHALVAVAAHLTDLDQRDAVLAEALVAARDERYHAEALAAVAAHLSNPGQLADALADARALRDERDRAEVLAAVAARLTDLGQRDAVLAEALAAACALEDEKHRTLALAAVARCLADHPAPARAPLVKAMLDAAAQLNRPGCLDVATNCVALTATNGGGDAVAAHARAIADIVAWYP